GAAIGWGLRPLFVRHRGAFVIAAAALAALGAAAYELLDDEAPVAEAPPVIVKAPLGQAASVPDVATATPAVDDSPFVADYLESAGNVAFADREYETAMRYWRDALARSSIASERQRDLESAIARAQRLAADER